MMRIRSHRAQTGVREAVVVLAAVLSIGSYAEAQTSAPSKTGARLSTRLQKAKEANPSKSSARWKIGTSALQWENKHERAQSVGLSMTLDLQHEFNKNFLVKAITGASMKSGYVQTRFGEISARNSVWLAEGYLQGKAGSVLTVRGGIIEQGVWEATSVIDGGSFPGSLQIIRFGDDYYVEVKTGQSIPVAADMDAKMRESEPTPTFMAETLKVGLQPKKGWLWASFHGGHWAFHNLPSKVAGDSDVGGNTIVTVDGKKRYKYEFEGWLAGASGQLNFTERTSLEAHLQVSQNTRAIEAYGAAQIAGGSLTIGLPGNVDLNSGVDFFFSESDASPAYYNSMEYGHNNREGYGVAVSAKFKEQGFKIGGMFTDASLINPHPLQVRQQLYLLSFGTNYAAF